MERMMTMQQAEPKKREILKITESYDYALTRDGDPNPINTDPNRHERVRFYFPCSG
jgi:hypothetical protein